MVMPGDLLPARVVTREDVSGVAVTGKVTADFSVVAFLNGASYALAGVAFTEISSGRYKLAYTMPSSPGMVDIFVLPASGTDIVWPGQFTGELERYDLESIAAINRPAAIAAATNLIGSQLDLQLVKVDYAVITATIVQADGVTPVDLSTWDTWQFGVQNDTQAAEGGYLPYLQTTGIVGTNAGILTITVPKTASLFSALTTLLLPSRQLWYSVNGNDGADATKPRTVLRGRLTVYREETR